MAFDFNKVPRIKTKSADPEWANPVSFFYKLSHPAIKDLFPVQNDVLKKWFADFKNGYNDKMVSLNTGGGKTLIGLMIAESIRRETGGKVIYVCPNNFLGKQTMEEADKCGLKVTSYLKLGTERPAWNEESLFLENNAICITTYSAALNPRSVFKDMEIKGVIFDDAHLSLNLLDDQFSIRSDEPELIKTISDIFKSSPFIKEKIASIQDGDPLSLIMIPLVEWQQQSETVKRILVANDRIRESLSWINLKEKLDRTFCFISARKIEIGFLYPDIKNHYIFHKETHRVYLSATLPNLDDLTRIFGVTPSRIQIDNPDYRPQRLFVYSKKLKIENAEDVIRKELLSISPKTLVLTPSNETLGPYSAVGAIIPKNSDDVPAKIQEFKTAPKGILALANRYDGIDMPGETCHSLLVDGLPYTGNLKTRFFSEFFHNHKNSFLRSVIASKLIQAFGRTIRANNDYSIIFLLGKRLNSWVINKDNKKFFRADLYEDIEIGLNISESISTIEELKSLAAEILGQTEGWKTFFEERKLSTGVAETLSEEDENKNVQVAQKERKIHDLFMAGNYKECVELILESQKDLLGYSRPILGLYLSIATVCCLKIGDKRAGELSSRAYGINPIFGTPITIKGIQISLQAQRIIDLDLQPEKYDWSLRDARFDENLKTLGDLLGFDSNRPEKDGEGTLDVCWVDEEKKIVIGFENKVDKTNKVLTKSESDQCSGHANWLREHYPDYKRYLYVVGTLEAYHELATPPSDLCHVNVEQISKINDQALEVHAKKIVPEQIDSSLDSMKLRIEALFPKHLVSMLPKQSFN